LPRVTRLLFALGRLSARAAMVLQYAAVGTMTSRELREAIRESWQGFHGRDEDIATGLLDWERDLVERFVAPGARVLIVGAGSGRDVVPLVERGCAVTGVEPASQALAVARRVLRERGLAATLVDGFFEDAVIAGPFDVVMFSYYSYSYIPGSSRRVGTLRKARALLADDGRILVSYSTVPPPHGMLIAAGRAAGAICRTDWRLEPGDVITAHSSALHGYAHAFAEGEIEREAADAGLRVVSHRRYPDPAAVLAK
jgi:SAM-dependent methyltransferase